MNWKCYYCETELKEGQECSCEDTKNKKAYITSNAVKTDNGYGCKCGEVQFKKVAHMDFTDFYSTTYECTKCGNHIGVQFQRYSGLF